MEPDDADGDDGQHAPLLPPDDRLWRHPSEVAAHGHPSPPAPSRRQWGATLSVVGTVALVMAAVAVRTGALPSGGGGGRTGRAASLVTSPVSTRTPSTVADLAQWLAPAVVQVRAERPGGEAVGSGVVMRDDGHVLTVHDAVAGATAITVVLAGGAELDARLVGADADAGLAVVKVDHQGMGAAPLADGAALRVGDAVRAVSCPGRGGGLATSVGTVQRLGTQVERPATGPLLDVIEADAPHPGLLGGPLVDAAGRVVGIIAAGYDDSAGRAHTFATPIAYARAVADQLIADGRVRRAWIGIEGADLDPDTAAALGLAGAAVVRQVVADGPGGRAGLAPGDVVAAVDGVPVVSMASLRVLLRAHRPGHVVTLTVVRATGRAAVAVTLEERPPV